MNCSPPGSSVHRASPGKYTGVGCQSLLQGIFPTQGSNPGLPHCKQILYQLSYQGMYCTIIWHLYTLQSNHHNKSSYHPSQYSWLTSPTLFTSQLPSFLVTGNLISVSTILAFSAVIVLCFVFKFHTGMKSGGICLSPSDISISIIQLRSIHVVANARI